MSSSSTPVLFLHGAWHGTWAWSGVMEQVTAAGRTALAVDMAGHGLLGRRPRYVTRRPFAAAAIATEMSPVADVDLDQAGDLLASQIKRLGRGGPVTVVAHSMGGTVLTRAAQQAPELVSHMVYVCAFMPASGVPAGPAAGSPENAGAIIGPPVWAADPVKVGAVRLDTTTDDPVYRRKLRDGLYGDVDPVVADAAIALLTPDVPLGILLGTTTLTRDGWGSIPRTYVRCSRDLAVRPALQRKFIADADSAFPQNPTAVFTLDASHSPFLSMPGQVADIVGKIG